MPKAAPNRRNLTPLFVSKVRAQPKAANYWDTKERGLCLRVQPSGHRAFKYVYSFRGAPRWYHLGQCHLGDARRIAARLRLAVIEGKDPVAERRAERSADTFGQLAGRYLEEHAKRRNRSWRKPRRLVERFALPPWADRPAKAISRADVKAVIARIKAPYTANATLASLSAIFSFGLREELVEANPCTGMSKNPVRSRERVATDDEIRRLWAALSPTVDQSTAEFAVLKVALLTGQRSSEVIHMRWQDVEATDTWLSVGAWWTLPGTPDGSWPGRKSGNSHRVWLTPFVLSVIGSQLHNATVIFGSKHLRLDRAMAAACKMASITPPLRPHDLRRSHATLVAKYFGRAPVSRVLGHADHTIAAVYDRHSYADEDRAIAEKISAHVLDVVERHRT